MGICWYCYWGWAKPVVEIYKEALLRLGNHDDGALMYSPSHIVWADENFENHSIEWCLKHYDDYDGELTPEELAVSRWSLEELLKIPEDIRCPEPEDYDGEHPELYPPQVETIRL